MSIGIEQLAYNQILNHSTLGNRVELNKLCNALVNFEITPEDLILLEEQDVENQHSSNSAIEFVVCDSTSNSEAPVYAKSAAKKLKQVRSYNQ